MTGKTIETSTAEYVRHITTGTFYATVQKPGNLKTVVNEAVSTVATTLYSLNGKISLSPEKYGKFSYEVGIVLAGWTGLCKFAAGNSQMRSWMYQVAANAEKIAFNTSTPSDDRYRARYVTFAFYAGLGANQTQYLEWLETAQRETLAQACAGLAEFKSLTLLTSGNIDRNHPKMYLTQLGEAAECAAYSLTRLS